MVFEISKISDRINAHTTWHQRRGLEAYTTIQITLPSLNALNSEPERSVTTTKRSVRFGDAGKPCRIYRIVVESRCRRITINKKENPTRPLTSDHGRPEFRIGRIKRESP